MQPQGRRYQPISSIIPVNLLQIASNILLIMPKNGYDLFTQLFNLHQFLQFLYALQQKRKETKEMILININDIKNMKQVQQLLYTKPTLAPLLQLTVKYLNFVEVRTQIYKNMNHLNYQLCRAVSQVDINYIQQLISLGANVNFQMDPPGSNQNISVLFLALRSLNQKNERNYVEMMKILFQRGVNWQSYKYRLRTKNKWGVQQISTSTAFECLPKVLLSFNSPQQRERFIQILVSYKVDFNNLYQIQYFRLSPNKNQNMTKRCYSNLLYSIIHLFGINNQGTRHEIIFQDKKKIWKILLDQIFKYGGNPNAYYYECNYQNGTTKWEQITALHRCLQPDFSKGAYEKGSLWFVEYLLQLGASANNYAVSVLVNNQNCQVGDKNYYQDAVQYAKKQTCRPAVIKLLQKNLKPKQPYDKWSEILSLAMRQKINEPVLNVLRSKLEKEKFHGQLNGIALKLLQ